MAAITFCERCGRTPDYCSCGQPRILNDHNELLVATPCAACGRTIEAFTRVAHSVAGVVHTECPRPAAWSDVTPRVFVPSSASHEFTCRRCGGHRDTTLRGRCDDCDA